MIKRAGLNDVRELANLAVQMWSDHDLEDLESNRIICFRKDL